MAWLVIAAVPVLVAVGLWALVDLERFVMFAVLGMLVFPASLAKPAGANIALADVLLLLAAVAWLVTNALRVSPDPYTRRNPLLFPALLYLLVNVASLLWSVNTHHTLLFVLQLTEIIILFPLVFASIPRSTSIIKRGLVFIVVLTCATSIAALITAAPRLASGGFQGVYLPGLNKNALGSFVAAGIVIAHALWLTEQKRSRRRLYALAALVEAGGLLASNSRGAMLGALAAILVDSFLLRRRRISTVVLVAVAAASYIAVVGVTAPLKRDASGGYDTSVVRQYSFRDAVQQIEQRPVLGTGARTYFDFIPQLKIGLPDPNNLFLLTWAELGIPGMITLVLLLATFGRLYLRGRHLPHESAALSVAAGGVALSLFVHFQVDVSWTRGTTSLAFAMMGIMLSLARLSAPPREDRGHPGVVPFQKGPEVPFVHLSLPEGHTTGRL